METQFIPQPNLKVLRRNLISSNHSISKSDLLLEFQPWHTDVQRCILEYIGRVPWMEEIHSQCDTFQRKMKPSKRLRLGNLLVEIDGLLGRGTRSYVYSAMILKNYGGQDSRCGCGAVLLVKTCLGDNSWEIYIATTLQERLVIYDPNCSGVDCVVKIYNFSTFYNGTISLYEYCPYGTMKDLVDFYCQREKHIPECIVMFFTFQILFALHEIHRCDIVHAYLIPEHVGISRLPDCEDAGGNLFHKDSYVKLLGFSRAIDMRVFKRGTVFKWRHEDTSEKCPAMQEHRSWVYEQDYYDILRIVHRLLYNDSLELRRDRSGWMPRNDVSNERFGNFWKELFDDLLNFRDRKRRRKLLNYCLTINAKLMAYKKLFREEIKSLRSTLFG